ncbi:MAG: OmpA family protein [Myxococcaceae bacterium]
MSRTAALGLSVILCASIAFAQATDPFRRSFDAVPVKPTPTANSGIAQDGAALPPQGSLHGAVLLDFNLGVLSLKLGDQKLGDLIPYRMDAHAMLSYQLHRRFEIAGSIPVTVLQGDNFELLNAQGFPQPGVSAVGLDDPRLLARFMLLDPETFPVALTVIGEVRAPLGAEQSFLGGHGFLLAPRVAIERAFGPLRVLGNAGYRFRDYGQFLNLYVGNEFHASAGVIYRFADYENISGIEALAEMHLSTPTNAPFNFQQADSLKSPWELLVGARARLVKNWGAELSIGRGIGLQSGYGREALRVIAGVRYDFSYADKDGDGITDDLDACVDQPEDKDGFEDSDGCPDPDNDQDGILDGQDQCPLEPGTKEMDGCPDRDGDDIPDNVDKCPDQPGPPENDGCPVEGPEVTLESDRIRVKGNVQFETASAQIQKQSYGLLDEVANVLKKNPKIGPVMIEGHTDNRGGRNYNIDLSERRAKSVEDYLVKRGIERKRLSHKGFGFDQPVATNDTPLGRAKNRRVDFRLTNDKDEKHEGSDSVKPNVQDNNAPPPQSESQKSQTDAKAATDANADAGTASAASSAKKEEKAPAEVKGAADAGTAVKKEEPPPAKKDEKKKAPPPPPAKKNVKAPAPKK